MDSSDAADAAPDAAEAAVFVDATDAADAGGPAEAGACSGELPAVPRALAPLSGQRAVQGAVALSWGPVACATRHEVRTCRSRDCGGETPAALSSTDARIALALEPGVHFWRVRAVSLAGASTDSPPWQLVVRPPASPLAAGATRAPFGQRFDLDGDARSDLLFAAAGSNTTPNDSRALFVSGAALSAPGAPSLRALEYAPASALTLPLGWGVGGGDLDGDGAIEGFIAGPLAGVAVLPSRVGASFDPTPRDVVPLSPTGLVGHFANGAATFVGDVNGDGYGDVVFGSQMSQRVWLYLGTARGLSASQAQEIGYGVGTFGQVIVGGDFDADGYSDVVVAAPEVKRLLLFKGGRSRAVATPSGPATAPGYLSYSGDLTANPMATYFGWSLASVGDFDGDGYEDLATGALPSEDAPGSHVCNTAYALAVRVYFGAATASLARTRDLSFGEYRNGGHQLAGVPDATGDGRDELLIATSTDVVLFVPGAVDQLVPLEMPLAAGMTARAPSCVDATSGDAVRITTGDFDGDGRGDAALLFSDGPAIRRFANCSAGCVAVFTSPSASSPLGHRLTLPLPAGLSPPSAPPLAGRGGV